MFNKIQNPNTGKWHKVTSSIGSKIIKNYATKTKTNRRHFSRGRNIQLFKADK